MLRMRVNIECLHTSPSTFFCPLLIYKRGEYGKFDKTLTFCLVSRFELIITFSYFLLRN